MVAHYLHPVLTIRFPGIAGLKLYSVYLKIRLSIIVENDHEFKIMLPQKEK